DVVGNRRQVLDVLAHERLDQIFRDAAQAEAADHDAGAVGNIAHRVVGAGHDFVHASMILNQAFMARSRFTFGNKNQDPSTRVSHAEESAWGSPPSLRMTAFFEYRDRNQSFSWLRARNLLPRSNSSRKAAPRR